MDKGILRAGARRRAFLRNAMLLALPAAAGGMAAMPARALSHSVYVPPMRKRGATRLDVRDFGARGDGMHDDTAAIQAAIDALPAQGGTVHIPAGKYLVDTVRSIRPRSQMLLELAPDAVLQAKPNAADRSYVLYVYKVSDVEIAGGRIIGDRYAHQGTTGEWGHGIFVRGSQRVTVRDIHLSNCWGDGMSIGGALVWQSPTIPSDDVVVANIVSTNNRRQGLSIGCVNNVRVRDSEFSNSNGTAPECGIDIEPDEPSSSYKVSIENCVLRGNNRYGLLAYKRSNATTIRRCTVEHNGSCGIVTVGSAAVSIALNTVRYNSATGVFIQDGTNDCEISRNTFYGNYSRNGIIDRTDFTLEGWSSKVERDILVKTAMTSDIRIATNYYR